MWLSVDATYTSPFASAGDENTAGPAPAVQSGAHVVGVPEQRVTPVASKA